MTPACLEQFHENEDQLVENIQWAGRILLKLPAVCQYFESVVTSEIRACREMKDLEERVTILQNEKAALERAKQDLLSEVEELKEQAKSKDQCLGEMKAQVEEMKTAQGKSTKKIFNLKAKFKYMED